MSKHNFCLMKKGRMFSQRKLHNGEMMSDVGSLLVMMFVVAILLLYIDYSDIVKTKIDLDNLNRNMLLTAEMNGGLDEADMDAFYENLESIGIARTDVDPATANFPVIEEKKQIPYGEEIEISYTINYPSPIYERFGNNSLFSGVVSPTIKIHIYGATVSKW